MNLNIKGKLIEASRPLVMGIINVTSDSFYAGSRIDVRRAAARAEEMISEGADIIDLGACSTRPGSKGKDAVEELQNLLPVVSALRESDSNIIISIDTYHAEVARECIEAGADIINDVSFCRADPRMMETIVDLNVPYILTHSRGSSQTMHNLADYNDVSADVLRELAFKTDELHQAGVCDVIIDPGFGFAKNIDDNYKILASLPVYKKLGCLILIGISRKSMIYNKLDITPEESLNGTTALNMAALMHGADILRVHDVKEAVETVSLYLSIKRNDEETRLITTSDSKGFKAFLI